MIHASVLEILLASGKSVTINFFPFLLSLSVYEVGVL